MGVEVMQAKLVEQRFLDDLMREQKCDFRNLVRDSAGYYPANRNFAVLHTLAFTGK